MDTVFIDALEIDTVIGVYDWEREIRQTVRLDLQMSWDIAKAAREDNLDQTLNYKAISDRVTEFVKSSEFLLVEALAEEVAQLILTEFSVPWLTLKLAKPGAVPEAEAVGVVIGRGNRDYKPSW